MYFVTGVTGFIGYHLASALLSEGKEVLGVNVLEKDDGQWLRDMRMKKLSVHPSFVFMPCDITDRSRLHECVQPYASRITHVIHLAARTGIRQSLMHPHAYAESNVVGQLNLLEQFRTFKRGEHFIYASSSSVYGANESIPFKETDGTDHPVSLYAATKKAAEIITESYAHLYRIHATGLRFFTVYGPYGRPDMAYFSFTRNILAGTPITLFNDGKMKRDFTFIEDLVDGVLKVLMRPRSKNHSHAIYNLGSGHSETLDALVHCIEEATGKKASVHHAPMQAGEMQETYADKLSKCDQNNADRDLFCATTGAG